MISENTLAAERQLCQDGYAGSMEAKRWMSNRKQEGIQEVQGAFPLEAPDDERARQEGLKTERVITWDRPSSLFQTKLVVVTEEQREDAGFLPAFPGVPW